MSFSSLLCKLLADDRVLLRAVLYPTSADDCAQSYAYKALPIIVLLTAATSSILARFVMASKPKLVPRGPFWESGLAAKGCNGGGPKSPVTLAQRGYKALDSPAIPADFWAAMKASTLSATLARSVERHAAMWIYVGDSDCFASDDEDTWSICSNTSGSSRGLTVLD